MRRHPKPILASVVAFVISCAFMFMADGKQKNKGKATKKRSNALVKKTTADLLRKKAKLPAHHVMTPRGKAGKRNAIQWTNCAMCHQTSSWKDLKNLSSFDHSATGFPLRGRHRQAKCTRCHSRQHNPKKEKNKTVRIRPTKGGQKRIRDCTDCHVYNHRSGQNSTYKNNLGDVHRGTQGKDCASCHNTLTWKRTVQFKRHQNSHFPLTGAHASTPCTGCHVHKNKTKFRRLSTQCVTCHAKKYSDKSVHPNHKKAGFSYQCLNCHTTYAWFPAKINHNLFWPLLGAHRKTPCSKCHKKNQYKGTPRDCIKCHDADYKKAGHTTPTFSHNCTTCHNLNSWATTTFPGHDVFFPITTGNHKGITCKQCHTNPKSSKDFTCLAPCHTKADMDNEHIGNVNGYVYESKKCLSCHPKGD